ncbi:MAG TPA: bacillithiol biosynthesis BshC [Thermoanaerobaculia bacterium]|nr:bacillithiol biosynthesis BshC [Thermoanaerobaculia bacterium]
MTATHPVIPYSEYPGLAPLFHDFLRGLRDFYPDPPTLDAALARGREIFAEGRKPRFPASAFRHRGGDAVRMAEDLAAGRAVGVSTGQQLGLFTGPFFTIAKAFDAIAIARQMTERGVPAVPVFWALTDDHDLQEIARTARPGADGAEELVLEGADRQNRRPVGPLPIPDRVREIVEAFRPDAKTEEAARILDSFARRSAPGVSYAEAFIETLLDLVAPDPLLVLDPLSEPLRAPSAELFLTACRRESDVRRALSETEQRLRRTGRAVPAPVPEGFSFFLIDADGRRRVTDVAAAAARVESGEATVSADVVTRPVLKSYLFPMAVSVLGAAEIAYHSQSLPLFPILDAPRPVLVPRTHAVLRGPVERRLQEKLGIADRDLLVAAVSGKAASHEPAPAGLDAPAKQADAALAALEPTLLAIDPTLSGALDTARKKIAYQFEQLAEKARKASERRDDVVAGKRRRLQVSLAPGGVPAERVYPLLVAMLAHGDEVRAALRDAAGGWRSGAAIVDVGAGAAGGDHGG